MSDTFHLLIPYAAGTSEASQQALAGLALPHLERLLARLTPHESDVADDDALCAPHERALARALGLPSAPGRIPWAAYHLHQQGRHDEAAQGAWAFVTPCHWRVGADHVTLEDPAQLQLNEEDSRALLALMAPWFEGDGITLHYDQPTRWLAQGALLADLATASPERVLHRDVSHWLPGEQKSHPLRRLHSEMQMLLYTHAFNDTREARGLPPVNAFWVHGAGCLAQPSMPTGPAPVVEDGLQGAALREDWAAWASAWQALDTGALARLDTHVARGGAARLTLCGERGALTWHTAPRSLGQRISSIFRPQRFADVREQL